MQTELISKITNEKKDLALEWLGLNFDYYDCLQPKMSVGMIYEHECSHLFLST